MRFFFRLSGVLALFLIFQSSIAQPLPLTATDSLDARLKKVESDLVTRNRLRITGYIQAHYQHIQATGAESMIGGNFPTNSNQRFLIRRSQLQARYRSRIGEFRMAVDASERGVVLRDAFLTLELPWTSNLSLTAGMFKRPFSYEVIESAGRRESPDIVRILQVIFPSERDLGFKLTYQPSKESGWDFIQFEAGLFNGTGGSASDFDSYKDFIGNISFDRTTANGNINYAFRVSTHQGGFRQPTRNVWRMGNPVVGLDGFVVDNSENNLGNRARQSLVGFDTQVSVKTALGTTTFRGEYIQGSQPGSAGSARIPVIAQTDDTYIRDVRGGYLTLLQRIANSSHRFLVKYDWFDPNTKVSGNDLGRAGSLLTRADVAYTTLGFGWLYDLDSNVQFAAYYDMPVNETSSNLTGFTRELEDNVLTLRLQYRF